MLLTEVLTAYHDPSAGGQHMLVSARSAAGEPRALHRIARPRPRVIRRRIDDGSLDECFDWSGRYPPAHGQVCGQYEHYALPPDWRWSLPAELALPTSPPSWLRCSMLFVWDDVAAVASLQDPGELRIAWHFDELAGALSTDILLVCTPLAEHALTQHRAAVGWMSFTAALPVVCTVDAFARNTSLDRTADGSASWYRAPFQFRPSSAVALSLQRRDELVASLVQHRREWLQERRVIDMMFSLSEMTRLPLHEAAAAGRTAIADALVEQTWMLEPLNLPPPQLTPRDESTEKTTTFEGGSVINAELGLHRRPVVMFDVSSLYPNVVLEYMSAEQPLLAAMFRRMIALRASERDPVRASSLKVATNARYGSLLYGLYRNAPLAAAITAEGRRVQHESLAALREHTFPGIDVIAGDTDSLVIAILPAVDSVNLVPQLLSVLNGSRQYARYKSDVDRMSVVFFVNNKNWAGMRAGSGEIVTRGLAQNRSVTPRFVLQAHHDWIRLVLTDELFQSQADRRTAWIRARGQQLRQAQWPIADLVVWPKPTRKHPDLDRGYVVVAPSREHVPYRDYIRSGRNQLPVDVDYLLQTYFYDDLARQSALLPGGGGAT